MRLIHLCGCVGLGLPIVGPQVVGLSDSWLQRYMYPGLTRRDLSDHVTECIPGS